MKLASLIRENIDIGDVLYSNRDQIELDFGPRTFKTLQSSLMMDDEAYVRSWLIKNGYMEEEKMPFEEIYDSPRKDYVVVDKRNLRPLKMNYGSGQFYEKWSTKEIAPADANELNNAYKKTYGAVEGPHVVMYKSDYYSEKRKTGDMNEGEVCESCGLIHEGSCGYTHTAGGEKLRTPGGTNDPAIDKIREYIRENLRNWFKKEKWKRIDTQGNIAGDCGTIPKGKKTQRCLPAAKARSLTKKQRAATSRKKTRSKKQFVKNTKAAKVKLKK